MAYLNFAEFDSGRGGAALLHGCRRRASAATTARPRCSSSGRNRSWYLIYQSQPPQYSTADDLADPATWTAPQERLSRRNHRQQACPRLSLDYWVICDDENCLHVLHWRRRQALPDADDTRRIPERLRHGRARGDSRTTSSICSKAARTYKVRGRRQVPDAGRSDRADGVATTARGPRARLESSWTPLAHTWEAPFAGENNVTFAAGRH